MKLRVVLGTPKFATGVRSEDGLRTIPSRTVCLDQRSRSGNGSEQKLTRDVYKRVLVDLLN